MLSVFDSITAAGRRADARPSHWPSRLAGADRALPVPGRRPGRHLPPARTGPRDRPQSSAPQSRRSADVRLVGRARAGRGSVRPGRRRARLPGARPDRRRRRTGPPRRGRRGPDRPLARGPGHARAAARSRAARESRAVADRSTRPVERRLSRTRPAGRRVGAAVRRPDVRRPGPDRGARRAGDRDLHERPRRGGGLAVRRRPPAAHSDLPTRPAASSKVGRWACAASAPRSAAPTPTRDTTSRMASVCCSSLGPSRDLALIQQNFGSFCNRTGDYRTAEQALSAAASHWRLMGDRNGLVGHARSRSAICTCGSAISSQAGAEFSDALTAARSVGALRLEAYATVSLGQWHRANGRIDRGRRRLRRGPAAGRGDRRTRAAGGYAGLARRGRAAAGRPGRRPPAAGPRPGRGAARRLEHHAGGGRSRARPPAPGRRRWRARRQPPRGGRRTRRRRVGSRPARRDAVLARHRVPEPRPRPAGDRVPRAGGRHRRGARHPRAAGGAGRRGWAAPAARSADRPQARLSGRGRAAAPRVRRPWTGCRRSTRQRARSTTSCRGSKSSCSARSCCTATASW